MAYIVFLYLLGFIAVIQASKPRSVNVALETVLEFDNKDDIEFIDTMQNFLQKLKTAITKHRDDTDQNKNGDNKKRFIFTDFLADTITVLNSYKDDDLKTFFHTLEREIKSWQTRKEFHEITDKLGFKKMIDRNLHNLKNSPPVDIRRELSNLFDKLKINRGDGNKGFIANFLNYIYKKESEAHLMNFLNNIKIFRTGPRGNNMTDLKRVIRNGIMTIIDPLLKLNSKTLDSINLFFKHIETNETKYKNDLHKSEMKIKHSQEKHEFKNVLKDNEILDYIEDHIKVIDKHLTSNAFSIKAKIKSIPKIVKNTGTTYKYIHTTRKNKKLKSKPSNLGRIIDRPREKQKPRRLTELLKNLGAERDTYTSNNDDRKPVLINLASNDNSELKSVEEYLTATKRNKKIARPRFISRRPHPNIRTTKYRKAFRTSTLSAEGLSIEHFGSLFGREFHRKNNDNDTFVQAIPNPRLPTATDIITTKDDSVGLYTETRRKNLSRENEEPQTENKETINTSEEVKDNKPIETVHEKRNLVTESIKIKGNIIIENPTDATTLKILEATTSTPVKTTTYRNYNVSMVTKYFNIQPMKPTIILRRQDVEISNETVTPSLTTAAQTTSMLSQTRNDSDKSETNEPKIKTTEDGLENEIEGIMDKYNNTAVSGKFENLIKGIQTNDDEGKGNKIREQMKADLAKLLAPPSTKSTATQIFTDPFDDIDAAVDLL